MKKKLQIEKDPLDKEIKLLVTFVLIAFVVGGLLPYIPHFIAPLADAADFFIKPDYRVQLQHSGTGTTCPVITSPTSATSVAGGTLAFQYHDQSSASGCYINSYIIEDSMFPEEWALLVHDVPGSGPAGGMRVVINLDEGDTDYTSGCEMWIPDDQTTGTDLDLVDPRLNATGAYHAFRSALSGDRWGSDSISSWQKCITSNTQGAESKPVHEDKYWNRVNQTFWSWGSFGATTFARDVTQDREVTLDDIFLRFTVNAPVNHTNNWWQMQEHPMYSGTYPVISDGFFGIDGTTFTMDTGTTNAQRGQVVAFKQFNKTELSQGNEVPVDNLVAYYTFEESSGNLLNRASDVGSTISFGSAADGTVEAGITRSDGGKIGSSYLFPGSATGQITLGSSLSQFNFLHNTTAKWTMNYWVNSTATSGSTALIQNNVGTTSNRGMNIGHVGGALSANESLLIVRGVLFDAVAGVSTTGAPLTNGVFNMVTFTFDYNNFTDIGNNTKVYVNGVLQNDDGLLGDPASDGNAPVALQMGGYGDIAPFAGNLDEFSIWNDELTPSEISTLYNSGSGLDLSTPSSTNLPDIRVQGGIMSLGSSDDVHLHVEVKDGNFQAGQTEGRNAIESTNYEEITTEGHDSVAYFERNQFMTYMDVTRDTLYSLGVYDLEDPTLGTADNFDISFRPNWEDSDNEIITVFVAIQDNSTSGRMIANVTSIEIENQIKYDFDDITDFVFYEPDCDTEMATTIDITSPSVVDNDKNCGLDYSNGLVQINNVTAGNITANTLPTPPNVTDLTAEFTDSILLDWEHDLVNVTGFRIYRTSTEAEDTQTFLNTYTGADTREVLGVLPTTTDPDAVAESGFSQQFIIPDLAGHIISDFTVGFLDDATTNPTGGQVKGVIFASAVGGSSLATLANSSDITYPENYWGATNPVQFNYKFRDDGLINVTTAQRATIGYGVIWEGRQSGQLEVGERDSGTGGCCQSHRWNSPGWGASGGRDLQITMNEVNQTKLFYNPYIMNTGNITTSYLDENVNDAHTYFYRVVALNGDVEGETVFIANQTEPQRVGTINDLQVFPVENNSVYMNWTEPIGDPDFYLIERSDGDKARLGSDDFVIYHENRLLAAPTFATGTEFAIGQEIVLTTNTNVTQIDIYMVRGAGACAGSGVLRGNIWSGNGATHIASSNATISGCSLIVSTLTNSSQISHFYFDPPVQLSSGTYHFGVNMTGTIDKTTDFRGTVGSEVSGVAESAPTDTFPYSFAAIGGTADLTMNVRKEDFRLIANITSSETNYTDSSISGLNSTWQWREHDTGGFTPLFTFTVGTENTVQIDSNAGSIGSGYLFKTFNKEDIENSTLRITWSQSTTQTGQIEVLDGAYDASSMTDFVNNGARATKGAGSLHQSSYSGSITERTTEIQPSDIAYEDSTLPQVTVFITAVDSSSGLAGTWNIREIDITKGATFHFPKATITTTVSATTNDYGTFDSDTVDHYLQDGMTYFYRVRGQNDIAVAVNGSNIAYTKEPFQQDGISEQVINSSSTRWYYREIDTYSQVFPGGGADPNYDFTTASDGVRIVTSTPTPYGLGALLKSFNKTEVFGSNITVGWSATLAAAGSANIRIYDGAFNAKNHPDFPAPVQSNGFMSDEQLGSQSAGSLSFTTQLTTLTNSSIDWEDSTEDYVTLLAYIDSSSGTTGIDIRIQNITISNIGTWVFDDGGLYVTNFEGNTESQIEDAWDNGYFDGANFMAVPPGTLTGLTGTAVNATVSLNWDDDPVADNYVVLRNGTQIGTPVPSDFIDSTPINNTFYNYTVYATNTGGNGTSASVFVTTNDFPTAPQNLTASMGIVIPDLEDVFLDWDAESDNGTGDPSTGVPVFTYWIERRAGIGPYGFLANVTFPSLDFNNTEFEDESVISGANYTWRVRGVNALGFSPYSNTYSLITTPLMPPNAPTNLTAIAVSGTQINIQWIAPVGGDPPTDYVLQQRHVGFTGFVTIATIPAPTLYYNVTGLLPGNTYDYRVRADNGAGSSAYSNIDQAVTFNVPSAPQNLNAITFNNSRIDITWQTPASVGGGILYYLLEYETPVGGGFTFLTNTTNLYYNHTGLIQNTFYNYRVNATNEVGTGAYSNQDNDQTHGVPNAPINLSYTTNGISTITVEWDAPVYTGGVPLTAYTIDQAQGIGGTFINAVPNDAVTPEDETFLGLLQSTNYIYRIAAKNQYGTGSYSANLTAGTFSGPSEPENFLAIFNSTYPYSVNLSWSVPLDDGGEPIQGYIIQRKDVGGIYQQIANVTNVTFTFTDTSLLQLATHTYRVAAYGSIGDFTADQPVTTVVTPHFQSFTIDAYDVLGDVLHQNYTVVIDDCFPACVLTQADIERNGIVESNYVVGSAIPLNTPISFSTYFIIPTTGTQFINTTAIVTNLGSNNSNETGVVTTQLQFVVPTLFFNHTRVNDYQDINFTLVRHPIPWDAECTHVIASTFLTPSIGISGTQPNISLQGIGSYNDLLNANPAQNSYIACYDPANTQILAFTSFGSGNGTLALTTFTNQLGDFMGVPVPFIFILFFAAIWTGRSAPTGIIMLSVVIGFLGVLGYFDPLSGSPTQTQSLEAFWGLIVILTLLGVFIGKRFF